MYTQPEIDFSAGIAARDAGIKQAEDHANAVSEKWSERAYQKLIEFIKVNKRFKAEDFRSYCAEIDFDLPPSSRAFGSVILRAAREYLIIKIGTVKVANPKAHCCYCTLWECNDERLIENGY